MLTVSELKDLLKHYRIALTGKKRDELMVLARSYGLLDAKDQPIPEALAAAKRRFWHKGELIDALKATDKAKRGDKLDKKDIHELLDFAIERGLLDTNYKLLVEIPEGSVPLKKPKTELKAKVAPVEGSVYKSVKTSLKSVVQDDVVIKKLEDAAIRANTIMTQGLQFMKLYLLHCYDSDIEFPKLTHEFVNTVLKVPCADPTTGRKASDETKALKAHLRQFYNKHYKQYVPDPVSYMHLNTSIDYMAEQVITMYENNIKGHFVEYVERFVNVSFDKKDTLEVMKTRPNYEKEKAKFVTELRKVKTDLLSPGVAFKSDPKYHKFIIREQPKVMPIRPLKQGNIKLDCAPVYYDLQCSPQDYLVKMLYMMKVVESKGLKLMSVFPLRSQIVPQHFVVDTVTLFYLCFEQKYGKASDYNGEGRLVSEADKLWKLFFRTEKGCFRSKKKGFDHMILTDGVACSIILKRKDLIGKRYANMSQSDRKKIPIQEQYIDDIDDAMQARLKGMNVAATDPNLSDLLYTVNSDAKDQVKFRYTQDTRRKETKAKKYRNYLQERKKEMVGNKSVEQWEAEMSEYNKKTVDFENFQKYVKQKNRLNRRLEPFYQEYIFRKLKLGSYMRRQITEARLIKRFAELFGSPEETVFAIGDFDQKQHRKFKEPVKGKGFRKLFRKAGYLVFLVNEFRTSCRCSHCHGECETFRWCKNPRPYRDGSIKRHGLVKCKTCSRLWNRDTNAASNIWKIAMCAIWGEPRPEYLCRLKSGS